MVNVLFVVLIVGDVAPVTAVVDLLGFVFFDLAVSRLPYYVEEHYESFVVVFLGSCKLWWILSRADS